MDFMMLSRANAPPGVVSWVASLSDNEASIRLHLDALEQGTASLLEEIIEFSSKRKS
jgi:hypothetical protein